MLKLKGLIGWKKGMAQKIITNPEEIEKYTSFRIVFENTEAFEPETITIIFSKGLEKYKKYVIDAIIKVIENLQKMKMEGENK